MFRKSFLVNSSFVLSMLLVTLSLLGSCGARLSMPMATVALPPPTLERTPTSLPSGTQVPTLQSGLPLAGHKSSVNQVIFSSDGKMLASASSDKTIILWDVATRQPISAPLIGHTQSVQSIAFSPDSKTLASASYDKTIILWDVSNPNVPTQIGKPIEGHKKEINSVAFSPNGQLLASGSNDETIILWDVTNRNAPVQLGAPFEGLGAIKVVVFSPDGKTLATGNTSGKVMLWDVSNPKASEREGVRLGRVYGIVWSVAFSPDGKTLVTADDFETMSFWDVSNPKAPVQLVGAINAHNRSSVKSVAFSPDGKTLASGGVALLIVWDVSNPKTPIPLGSPIREEGFIESVAFSPDGKWLASASSGSPIILRDVSAATLQKLTPMPLAPTSTPTITRTPPLKSAVQIGTPLVHTDRVYGVAFSPDGKILASSVTSGLNTCGVVLWDVSNLLAPVQLSVAPPLLDSNFKYGCTLSPLMFSSNGKMLMGITSSGTTALWDVSNPKSPTRIIPGVWQNPDAERSSAISPDGKIIASSTASRVTLWDITNIDAWKSLSTFDTRQFDMLAMTFAPNGKLFATRSWDNVVIVWDVSNPSAPVQLGKPLDAPGNDEVLLFSDDSRILASGGENNKILLWDVSEPQTPVSITTPLSPYKSYVRSIDFGVDNTMLAYTSGDTMIVLWNVSKRNAPVRLPDLVGHTDTVNAVAFSPDGKTLVSSSRDKTVILWDVSTIASSPTPTAIPTSTPTPSPTPRAYAISTATPNLPNALNLHLGWVWFQQGLRLADEFAVGPDGTMYLTDEKGTIHAITSSGKELWSYRGDYDFISSDECPVLSRDGKTIYFIGTSVVGSAKFESGLYALGTDGKLRWTYKPDSTRSPFGQSIVAPDGTVYTNGFGGGYRFSPDGQAEPFKWSNFFGPDSAAFDLQGKLYARDWSEVWVYSTQGQKIQTCPIKDLAGNLVSNLKDGFIYVTLKGDLSASDSQCKQLWRYSAGETTRNPWTSVIAAADGTIYAARDNGEIHAMNVDGKLLWKTNANQIPDGVLHLVAGPNGLLYVVSKSNQILAFDGKGQQVWSDTLYDSGTPGTPRLVETSRLAIVNANRLYYFTRDSAIAYPQRTPVPPPADFKQAEEEVIAFVLDYITAMPNAKRVPSIIVWGQGGGQTPGSGSSNPKQVWWYEGGKLTQRTDMTAAIAEYRDRYMRSGNMDASYGYIDFTISVNMEDPQKAEVYMGAMWAPLYGSGFVYQLRRGPDGHWWIVDSKMVWIS